jgi:hypothetical protein
MDVYVVVARLGEPLDHGNVSFWIGTANDCLGDVVFGHELGGLLEVARERQSASVSISGPRCSTAARQELRAAASSARALGDGSSDHAGNAVWRRSKASLSARSADSGSP